MVLVKLGDYSGASANLEKAMTRYEKDFDANYYLGEAYRAQDKYAEAIYRYKQALRIKENDPRALKPLAWSYFKIRYYSEALAVGKELQKIAPNDDQVAIIVSRTLLKMKRSKEALTTLQKARKNIAKTSEAFYSSVEGDILYELKDTPGAIKSYKEALKEQPLLAGALLGVGRCLLDEGKVTQAISYMERAVRVRPRLTEGHFLLGRAYEPIDKTKSLRYYQAFRRQAAADPEYLGYLSEVKSRMSALQSTSKTPEATSSGDTAR
jgi:tetratricopeptide (TPR) repeat protein